jgi:hypothetical protein
MLYICLFLMQRHTAYTTSTVIPLWNCFLALNQFSFLDWSLRFSKLNTFTNQFVNE